MVLTVTEKAFGEGPIAVAGSIQSLIVHIFHIKDSNESEVLLVSSSARPQKWIIPGGKVKPEEEPETSAAREALEEAGVVGKLGRCLGIFDNMERRHRTRVYILTVEQLLEQYDVGSHNVSIIYKTEYQSSDLQPGVLVP